MTKKIPRLSLRLNALLDKAECFEGLYTYTSDLEHTAFITDGEDILIITSKSGYLRLPGYQVDKLAEERLDVKFGKINVDEEPQLAAKFGVVSIPTLVVMDGGAIVAQAVGARPKEMILEMLNFD